jgi:hypothetical protein
MLACVTAALGSQESRTTSCESELVPLFIFFDFGSARLNEHGNAQVAKAVEAAGAGRPVRVFVAHDHRERRTINRNRAETIRAELVRLGAIESSIAVNDASERLVGMMCPPELVKWPMLIEFYGPHNDS